MDLTLLRTHELKGNGYFLGLQGENKSETLNITIKDETLLNKWAYIEFKNNNNDKWSTPRLAINGNLISYELVSGILQEGKVSIQVVFRDENGFVWKSYTREFVVGEALCVSDDLPQENPDFITEAQKLLDQCEGTKNEMDATSKDLTKRVETCEDICENVVATELSRVANENERILSENARAIEEANRVKNEALRASNEEARVSNENTRVENEDVRLANEQTRQANETLRVEAEQSRIAYLQSELAIRDKLILNLQLANEGKTYANVVNDVVAYSKTNPSGVLPYTIINRVGGMSYVVDETFRHTPITNIRSVGKNIFNVKNVELLTNFNDNNISITKVDDTSITITSKEEYSANGYIDTTKKLRDLAPSLVAGKTYFLSATTPSIQKQIYLANKNNSALSKNLSFNKTFTLSEEELDYIVYLYGFSAFHGDGTGDCVISNIQIEEGEVATNYEPYVEHSLAIPSEVQALEGYGLGINSEYYNYIDFKNKKFIQRVSEYVFNGSEYWAKNDDSPSGQYVSFFTGKNTMGALEEPYIPSLSLSFDSVDWDSFSEGECFWNARTSCGFRINKDKLTNYDSLTTDEERIQAFKDWLRENNQTIIFVKATPIEIDISQYINNNLIEVVEGGSITFENEHSQETPSNITYQTKL